jgi:hypothetical protein
MNARAKKSAIRRYIRYPNSPRGAALARPPGQPFISPCLPPSLEMRAGACCVSTLHVHGNRFCCA